MAGKGNQTVTIEVPLNVRTLLRIGGFLLKVATVAAAVVIGVSTYYIVGPVERLASAVERLTDRLDANDAEDDARDVEIGKLQEKVRGLERFQSSQPREVRGRGRLPSDGD